MLDNLFDNYSKADLAVAAGLGFLGGLAAAKAANEGLLGQKAQGFFSNKEEFTSTSIQSFEKALELRSKEEAKEKKAQAAAKEAAKVHDLLDGINAVRQAEKKSEAAKAAAATKKLLEEAKNA